MKRSILGGVLAALAVSSLVIAPVQAASIAYFYTFNPNFFGDTDDLIVNFLESNGHTVEMFDTTFTTAAQQQAVAMSHDVTLISQTIPSSAVVEKSAFTLKDIPRPIISFEPYIWDNAGWTGSGQFFTHGNTGRPEVVSLGLGNLVDSIHIVDPGHPLAAGFSGEVVVYTLPYSVNFGVVGLEADVVATADAAGNFPTTFIYETGAELWDGSIAPAPRIGLFLGQDPTGNPLSPGQLEFSFINANGLAMILASIEGSPSTPGDFDTDGDVDGNDFLVWQRDTSVGSLSDWENNFGSSGAIVASLAATAVPEPASAMLALMGLGLLAVSQWRKNRSI